jgi:hypothetical protein
LHSCAALSRTSYSHRKPTRKVSLSEHGSACSISSMTARGQLPHGLPGFLPRGSARFAGLRWTAFGWMTTR